MSNAPRRRTAPSTEGVEFRTARDVVKATIMGWEGSEECISEDFVNCSFGASGECKNPRHHRNFTSE